MNSLKLLFNASAVVGLCTLSGQGWAGCSIVNGSAATAREFTIGTLSVPPGASIGTLLKTVTVPDTASTKISCSSTANYWRFQYGFGTERTAVTRPGVPAGVVSSGVEGIGVRVISDNIIMIATLPDTIGTRAYNTVGAVSWSSAVQVRIQFYKTGDITPGELVFPKNFIEMWASGSPTSTAAADGVLYSTLNISGTPELKVPGCVTPSLTVPLGKHAKSDFSGIGSTSASTPFTFAINNCDAGLTAVKYTFKPATGITLEDSGLATQHLTVKSGPGTASGIGVQVLYNNDTLVPFNTAISTTAGSHTIPMKARYIQTASAISAGDANSALEFTMTYQ
ncbi:TPA: hypothetical protein I8287_004135 [Kluyvera intermedia]|nr:hypothetical protein [Kluyvera intermedia]